MEKAAAVTLILTVLLILLRGKCAGVEVYGAFLSGAAEPQGVVHALARCARRTLFPAQSPVSAGGRPVPLLGSVGMNHLLVDLTDAPEREAVRIDVSPLLVRREIPRRLIAGDAV